MPVRIAAPTGIGGLVDTILNPGYSTAVGLLQWGALEPRRRRAAALRVGAGDGRPRPPPGRAPLDLPLGRGSRASRELAPRISERSVTPAAPDVRLPQWTPARSRVRTGNGARRSTDLTGGLPRGSRRATPGKATGCCRCSCPRDGGPRDPRARRGLGRRRARRARPAAPARRPLAAPPRIAGPRRRPRRAAARAAVADGAGRRRTARPRDVAVDRAPRPERATTRRGRSCSASSRADDPDRLAAEPFPAAARERR